MCNLPSSAVMPRNYDLLTRRRRHPSTPASRLYPEMLGRVRLIWNQLRFRLEVKIRRSRVMIAIELQR